MQIPGSSICNKEKDSYSEVNDLEEDQLEEWIVRHEDKQHDKEYSTNTEEGHMHVLVPSVVLVFLVESAVFVPHMSVSLELFLVLVEEETGHHWEENRATKKEKTQSWAEYIQWVWEVELERLKLRVNYI